MPLMFKLKMQQYHYCLANINNTINYLISIGLTPAYDILSQY